MELLKNPLLFAGAAVVIMLLPYLGKIPWSSILAFFKRTPEPVAEDDLCSVVAHYAAIKKYCANRPQAAAALQSLWKLLDEEVKA